MLLIVTDKKMLWKNNKSGILYTFCDDSSGKCYSFLMGFNY